MKMIFKPTLLLFFMVMTFMSCNNEELFLEPTADVIVDNPADIPTEDTTPNINSDEPCDFTLDAVQAGDTVIINCMMDLGGQTVTLPDNVTILYEGGDIINGTLIFPDGSIISGELLNNTLVLSGSKPQLKDIEFTFVPSRWGIVEGETTSDIAQRNNNILENLMFSVKEMGVTTFKIDKLDAYFEVSKMTSTTSNQNFYLNQEAINIPSDFNLVMTDNTILRVFPTVRERSAALMSIDEVSNTTITGGVLYGDRDIRDYTEANKGGGTLLLLIRSGKNITIDGVKFTMSARAGVNISSNAFTFTPEYDPSRNVTVKNCEFNKIREMGMSITDGTNIVVDNNTFIDTAQPTTNSDGGVVGYAINIEPTRYRDDNGELVLWQKVDHVVIKNNKETGSREGSFGIYIGENIIIENNEIEASVTYGFASNSIIRNNNFLSEGNSEKPAIIAGGVGDTVFNNSIYGNTITGYDIGINATHRDVDIFENKIYGCVSGIALKESIDMKIHHNTIENRSSFSRGITGHIADINNVEIYSNEIDVVTNPLWFVQLNQLDSSIDYSLNVHDNIFTGSGKITMENSRGVTFVDNIVNCGIQVFEGKNINILSNQITTLNAHGIFLRSENFNINLNNNEISYPNTGNYECIKIDATTNASEVSNLETNTCN